MNEFLQVLNIFEKPTKVVLKLIQVCKKKGKEKGIFLVVQKKKVLKHHQTLFLP